jgi:hypothetical protein
MMRLALSQKNPFSPAVAKGLYARMVADGATTFAKKVSWVKKHIPDIDDPASFVAVLVRQEEGMATKKAAIKKAATKRNPAAAGVDEHAVRELVLFFENDSHLWTRRLPEYAKNLATKMKRGTYDAGQAVKLIEYLAQEGATKYRKEFGGPASMFSPATRRQAAIELLPSVVEKAEEMQAATKSRNPAAPKKAAPKKAATKKAATKKAAPKRNPGPDEHKARARQSLQISDDMFFEAEGMSQPERKIAAYMHSAAVANAARQDFADASDEKGVKDARDLFRRAREEALEVVSGLKSRNPNKTVEAHHFCVHAKDGRLVAYTTTLAEAQSVMPKGGHIKPLM